MHSVIRHFISRQVNYALVSKNCDNNVFVLIYVLDKDQLGSTTLTISTLYRRYLVFMRV